MAVFYESPEERRLPSQRPQPPLTESPSRWPCWHVEPQVDPATVRRAAEVAWQATGVPQRVSQPGAPDVVYGCPHPRHWQHPAGCLACGADPSTIAAQAAG